MPEPGCPPGGAVVRVSAAGVCGTDLHLLDGHLPGLRPGSVLGHEVAGVVAAVGVGVRSVAVGQRVVASCVLSCGECWQCVRGATGRCGSVRLLGGGRFLGDLPGGQADLVAVPDADRHLLAVPGFLPDAAAVLLADVLPTAYEAVARARPAGEAVLVQGCGPLGLATAALARLAGAVEVLALDPVPARRDAAARLGAVTYGTDPAGWAGAVRAATGGRGADVVLDCVGGVAGFDQAVALVRPGGRLVIVGVQTARRQPVAMRELFTKAVEVVFTGLVSVPARWPPLLDLLTTGRLDPGVVPVREVPLAAAAEGYRAFRDAEAVKIVLVPGG